MTDREQKVCFERWNGQSVWQYGPRSGRKNELRRGIVQRVMNGAERTCSVRFTEHFTVTDYADNFLSLFEIKILASGGLLESGTIGTWAAPQASEFFAEWNKVFHYIIANPEKSVAYTPIECNENWDVKREGPVDYMSMLTLDLFLLANGLATYIRYADEFNVETTYKQKEYAILEGEIKRRNQQQQFKDYCKVNA